MKTSNKLLLIAFALLLAGAVFTIIKVKQFFVTDKIELSGVTKSETRDISGFNAIVVEGNINLNISKGEKNTLTMDADTAVLNKVSVTHSDSTLRIKIRSPHHNDWEINATLITTNMKIYKLDASAGAKLKTNDTVKAKNVSVSSAAGSFVNFPVVSNSVECNAVAGAGAELSGTTIGFNASATAGAHIRAGNLVARDVQAHAIAGGSILVNAQQTLDVNCTAGGVVRYKGHPDMKNINISAGGNLSKVED